MNVFSVLRILLIELHLRYLREIVLMKSSLIKLLHMVKSEYLVALLTSIIKRDMDISLLPEAGSVCLWAIPMGRIFIIWNSSTIAALSKAPHRRIPMRGGIPATAARWTMLAAIASSTARLR